MSLRVGVLVQHHDVSRQIVAFAAQAITEPGTQARSPGLLVTGLKKRDGGVVIDRFGVHRLDDADVVGDLAMKRQQVTNPLARFTVLPKRHE